MRYVRCLRDLRGCDSQLVEEAEAAFKDFSQKGEISMALKQMPFGKVFGIKDPAGQPQYLVEFVKDRPSQPVK